MNNRLNFNTIERYQVYKYEGLRCACLTKRKILKEMEDIDEFDLSDDLWEYEDLMEWSFPR